MHKIQPKIILFTTWLVALEKNRALPLTVPLRACVRRSPASVVMLYYCAAFGGARNAPAVSDITSCKNAAGEKFLSIDNTLRYFGKTVNRHATKSYRSLAQQSKLPRHAPIIREAPLLGDFATRNPIDRDFVHLDAFPRWLQAQERALVGAPRDVA
jgi:hypothetical protein